MRPSALKAGVTTATGLRPAARRPGNSRRVRLAGAWAALLIAALAPASARGQGPAAPLGGRLRYPAASGEKPCYAFLSGPFIVPSPEKADRLRISCDGQSAAVTRQMPDSPYINFAVSPGRMVLALADGAGRVRVFSLRPPYQELPWRGPTGDDVQMWGLQTTCGTVAVWTARGTVDGLTGAVIQAGPKAGFVACDRDRSVAVGVSASWLNTRGSKRPAHLLLGGDDVADTELNFAVSPGGSWYAYVYDSGGPYHPRWPICVFTTAGPAESGGCTPECDLGWHAGGGARLGSVADDGSVIFAAGSYANPCPSCSSIYYWNPNTPKPVLPALLQRSGADPQWITPAAARALVARYRYLRAHRKHAAHKGPQDNKKARSPAA